MGGADDFQLMDTTHLITDAISRMPVSPVYVAQLEERAHAAEALVRAVNNTSPAGAIAEPPPPPPNNDAMTPLGMERMGWEVYQNYWASYPADVRALLNTLYGWTDICVRILAEDLAAIERVAYLDTTTEEQQAKQALPTGHFASRLERNPCPGILTKQQYRELKARWLYTTGNVIEFTPIYVEEPTDKSTFVTDNPKLIGMPAAKYILETSRVYVVADPNRFVKQYVYFSNSGPRYFEPWEICHTRVLYPNDDPLKHLLWGSSPIEHAWKAIAASMSLQDYITSFFQNFAMPPVVVSKLKGTWSPIEKDQFELAWIQKFRGKGGKIGFSDGNVKIEAPIDTTANQKALYEINEWAAEEICAHFGVTLSRVVGKYQNKATGATVRDDYQTGPLRAKIQLMDEAESAHYQRYEAGVFIESVTPRTSNEEFELKRQLQALQTAQVTPNQLAEQNGFAGDNPDGDNYFLATNLLPLSSAMQAGAPAPGGTGTPAPAESSFALRLRLLDKLKRNGRLTMAESAAFKATFADAMEDDGEGYNKADATYGVWKSLDTIRRRATRKIEKGVAKAFGEARERMMARALKAIRKGDENARAFEFTDADAKALKKRLVELCGEEAANLIVETLQVAVEDAGGAPAETDWQDLIDKAVDRSIDKITTSAGTVKEELRALLQEMKDRPVEEVTEAIKQKFDQYEDSGASRIATTTTTYAQGTTTRGVHKELGLSSMWLNLRIAATPRSYHLALHRQVRAPGETWHVTHDGDAADVSHPGEGPAWNAINCHCQLKAVRG